MKAPLILVVSEKMDTNRKKSRYEDKLIRMGEKARDTLGLKNEKTVELWPEGPAIDRISRSKMLEIFKAYSGDIKRIKESMPEDDYTRVGFVTSRTFDFICKDSKKKKENIWIADTVEETVVGADPEFVLMNNDGSIKYAGEIGGFSYSDVLGSDGPWAEIRPAPEVKVVNFVNNIRDILRHHKNTELIQKYLWMGGCYYNSTREDGDRREWPIGGHIHLGTPGKLSKVIANNNISNYEYALYSCLTKILDEYLAVPLMYVDGIQNSISRRSRFGYYGDVRTDHGRLEYRSLSGEWLTHPDMATMTIGTTKAIAHAFFKMLDEVDYDAKFVMTKAQFEHNNTDRNFDFFNSSFNGWKDIGITKEFKATKSSARMREILQSGKIAFNKSSFTSLDGKLKSLSTYKEYSKFIDAFIELFKLPKKVIHDRDKDLKHNWVGNKEFII